MENKFGLPDRTIKELTEYFSGKPQIEKVLIYGSRSKGTYNNGSDIDFAIWATNIDTNEILWDLNEMYTPYKFDVTDYKSLKHEGLKNSIDTDGKLFYIKNSSND